MSVKVNKYLLYCNFENTNKYFFKMKLFYNPDKTFHSNNSN